MSTRIKTLALTLVAVAALGMTGCSAGADSLNSDEFTARAQSLQSYRTLPTNRLIEFAQSYCAYLSENADTDAELLTARENYIQISGAEGRTATDAESFGETAVLRYCSEFGPRLDIHK